MTVNYIVKGKSSSPVKPILLLLLYAVVYVILFEFILPVNYFLPKPTILYDSLISLQLHYNLGYNFLYTATLVYLAMILSYLLLSLSAGWIIRFYVNDNAFVNSLKIFKYISIPILAAVFVLWIPNAIADEMLFVLLLSFLYLVRGLTKRIKTVKSEYIDPIVSLHVKDEVIYRDVIWKSLEPTVISSFTELNFVLWTTVLLFEFMRGGLGAGYILKMSLEYNDLSGIIVLSIITAIAIYIGNSLVKAAQKKLIRWEP